MRALVIGYGSIGSRHIKILKEMGFSITILSKQKGLPEKTFTNMLSGKNCPVVNIHINYLERTPRRELLINTAKKSIKLDLIEGSFQVNGEVEPFIFLL